MAARDSDKVTQPLLHGGGALLSRAARLSQRLVRFCNQWFGRPLSVLRGSEAPGFKPGAPDLVVQVRSVMAEVGLDIRGCSEEFRALAGYILFDTRMDFAEAWMSPFEAAAHEFRCAPSVSGWSAKFFLCSTAAASLRLRRQPAASSANPEDELPLCGLAEACGKE